MMTILKKIAMLSVAIALPLTLLAGCPYQADDPLDGATPDLNLDQSVAETSPADAPGMEATVPDTGPPNPDGAICPASRSVWGTFNWSEGCLWQ